MNASKYVEKANFAFSLASYMSRVVSWCFMIFVLSSELVHVEIGEKEKLSNMKILSLKSSLAIIYFAPKILGLNSFPNYRLLGINWIKCSFYNIYH